MDESESRVRAARATGWTGLVAFAITFATGASLLVAGVAPGGEFIGLEHRLSVWFDILAAFALTAGGRHLVARHTESIRERRADRRESIAALAGFAFTLAAGLFKLGARSWDSSVLERGTWFRLVADTIYAPVAGAFAAVIAFALASAILRAARRRTLGGSVLLLAAGIFIAARAARLRGLVTEGEAPSPYDRTILVEGLIAIPATAGLRALMIGIAIGVVASGVRLLFGADRVT
jgi:hypothetical protein